MIETKNRLNQTVRSAWTRLIQKVYEVASLVRPRCQEEMRFMAVIEEDLVIEQILRHIGTWDPSPPLRAPPIEYAWPEHSQIPLTILC